MRIHTPIPLLLLGVALLILLFQRCQTVQPGLPPDEPARETVTPDYTDADDGPDTDSVDTDYERDAARAAAVTGKVLLQYMNNENEVFRPSAWKVELYWFASEPAQRGQQDYSTLTAGGFKKPTYTVFKSNNGRAYTRKTVKAGWYLAEFDESGYYYRFEVRPGSDGILIMNGNNPQAPLFAGYYPAYGKIKFQFGKGAGHEDVAFLNLTQGGATQPFWLYAQDSANRLKSQYWFMPVGSYGFEYYAGKPEATHKLGSMVIASGKVYPNLNL